MTDETQASQGDADTNAFFAGLRDVRFETFITQRAISAIYTLGTITILLLGLAFWFAGLSRGGVSAAMSFFLIPIVTLMYVVFFRMTLEVLIVQFSQADLLRKIADKL